MIFADIIDLLAVYKLNPMQKNTLTRIKYVFILTVIYEYFEGAVSGELKVLNIFTKNFYSNQRALLMKALFS